MNEVERNTVLSQWVPMPRYLLRCWVVKRLISAVRPKDFIEIGSASGEMAQWMSRQQIPGVAVEISPQALRMLRARLHGDSRVRIFDADAGELDEQTDLLLSMEVLEHLPDDRGALEDWYRLIRPGGYLLLSVPAGKRLFSVEDELVGHYRRYEQRELVEKIRAAGFLRPEVLSYGFPIGLLLKRLRNMVAAGKLRTDRRSRQQRTEGSGVERRFSSLRWLLNDFFFMPFHLLQMPFLRCDITDGYIALAQKPAQLGAIPVAE